MAPRDDATHDATLLRALLAEIQALRLEVAELRQELRGVRPPLVEPAPAPSSAVSASSWMQRRNAERLSAEVQRRQAVQPDAGVDGEADTELDLMIDRLHDLALDNGG